MIVKYYGLDVQSKLASSNGKETLRDSGVGELDLFAVSLGSGDQYQYNKGSFSSVLRDFEKEKSSDKKDAMAFVVAAYFGPFLKNYYRKNDKVINPYYGKVLDFCSSLIKGVDWARVRKSIASRRFHGSWYQT